MTNPTLQRLSDSAAGDGICVTLAAKLRVFDIDAQPVMMNSRGTPGRAPKYKGVVSHGYLPDHMRDQVQPGRK
jgi:hypothetical protein